jgi:hypothetical protein
MEKEPREAPEVEYEKPKIRDYGDLKELTAASKQGAITDVPKGFPAAFS